MKIGLSTTSIEPARNGGLMDGIGHYTLDLKRALEGAGHTVEGYAFPGVRKSGEPMEFGRAMPASLPVMAGAAIAGPGRLRPFAPDVDVFHSTDYKVVPMRVPVVATIWDAIPLTHPEWLSRRARLTAPFLIRRMTRFADQVIAASTDAARDITQHYGVPEDKISIVPWGIGADWRAPAEPDRIAAVKARYELEEGFFLTVGTIQPRKNVETLLEAYRALPETVRANRKLVIVGRFGWGSEDFRSQLEAMTREGAVKWLDDVEDDADLKALYSLAGIFVFPSLHEGFGIPLIEAFASGVPVVVSNRTSLPEISNGAALEIDPLDVGAMSRAMAALDQDPELWARHQALGLARVERYTVETAMAGTVRVYERAMAQARRR